MKVFRLSLFRLKKIYVLSMGESLSIEPMRGQEALAQLIAHSYMARFGNQLLRGKSAIQHLSQCGKLINECSGLLVTSATLFGRTFGHS